MASTKNKIIFENGQEVVLSTGEINAIERCAQANGTDPKLVQYNPGSVHYRTLNNLVEKGIMRRDGGLFHFVAGFLPVRPATAHGSTPFTLDRPKDKPVSIFKIQLAPRIDHITDDGTALTQLPYPIHADNKGNVEFQEIHAGTITKIMGFQKDLAKNRIDLSWSAAQKDRAQAVGMYLITQDGHGDWFVHLTAVDTFEMVGL